MEQSYFQIQLDRAIKETERLLKQLNAVKTDYANMRIEEALAKSVTAAKISEGVALKTRALPAYTSHPQADAMVQNAIEEVVPVEMGFTEEGWFCLRMPILLPRKEKSSRSYLREFLYLALEKFSNGKEKLRYDNYMYEFDDHTFSGNARHVERNHLVAETAVMCMKAGIEANPLYTPEVMDDAVRRLRLTEPCFYFARELKRVNDYELNKIRFVPLSEFGRWFIQETIIPEKGWKLYDSILEAKKTINKNTP